MADKTTEELSLADAIVGRATAKPSALTSRNRTKGIMSQEKTLMDAEPEYEIPSYVQDYVSTIQEERSPLAVATSVRPKSYSDSVSELKQPAKAESLQQDEAFMANLTRMKNKYPGLSEKEVFKVIEGESAYNPKAKSVAGAVGLFQIMPEVLGELGFTPAEVLDMEPAEQLLVYEKYLQRWDYDGNTGLGILQAAPAFRNADPDTVIYKKGSKAWQQNKGWRSRGNGDITKRSIEAYYGRVNR
jgi:hypothetical protein